MGDQHKLKKWTLMVYLAGDNNLEAYGTKDLGEMATVGSSDHVAIVAQFDRMSDQRTRRYYISANRDLETNCIAELPEVNTGDPSALLDFITWACQTYPAERHGLVLWNHGAGWKDEDIYRSAQRQGVVDRVTRGQVRGLASGKVSRAFFRPTLDRLVAEAVQSERAILFDDSSADFLDNIEMQSVLREATRKIGQPLDLLGFDACLMNMLEVHYQVRDLCHVVVGSQESEPGDGWPYDAILARLAADPDMTAEDLGRAIVQAYVAFYQAHFPGLSVTQSAVRLAGIDAVVDALDGLARALVNSLADRGMQGLLFGALRSAQSFSDRDYVDLVHFCQLLARADDSGQVGAAAQQVADLLRGETSPLVAEGHYGSEVINARGLSIYLPVRILSPLYGQLEFAQQHSWDEFLDALIHPDRTSR
jgi:hypothetical protein